MAECTGKEVKLDEGGHWVKCIGGQWVRLATPPVVPGQVGAMIAIDRAADLRSDDIEEAIRDPKKQVVVHVIDLDED